MLKYFRTHKRIFWDFSYSFVAYALPTIVLQFAIQPLIAGRTSAEENGLFVAIFNVIKLMVSVFISPLANLRLLKKQECEKNGFINSFFNHLFLTAVFCSILLGSILNELYRDFVFRISDIVLLSSILILMSIHDYFMVEFRLILNYRKIVVDNCLIILGYGIGILLFIKTGIWELIFVFGYLLGSIYVLLNTNLWKSIPRRKKSVGITKQYIELSASNMLGLTSVYCDRLIIYPVLGGFEVSVYNAAAVVSKAISVVGVPLKNVLLSYIVNHNGLVISKKSLKKFVPISIFAVMVVFAIILGISVMSCRLLYPQYATAALPFIPIITIAVMVQTFAEILNIVLLRFTATKLQTIISSIKLSVYLIAAFLLAIVADAGLMGFCFAILLADISCAIAVLISLKKNISFIA